MNCYVQGSAINFFSTIEKGTTELYQYMMAAMIQPLWACALQYERKFPLQENDSNASCTRSMRT